MLGSFDVCYHLIKIYLKMYLLLRGGSSFDYDLLDVGCYLLFSTYYVGLYIIGNLILH